MRGTQRLLSVTVAVVLGAAALAVPAHAAEPGESPDNPIVVAAPSDVPKGAVEDAESTYITDAECDTTRSWVLTTPAVDEVTHEEYRYLREIPAQEEVSHQEYRYERQVNDYKTQYHFRKYVRVKTQAPASEEIWANFSPNRDQGPFTGPPTWDTDARGTWQLHAKIPGGHAGPDGVYQKGQGNSSWFYRQNSVEQAWSEYGPWTAWVPETHTSWEDSDAPLGSPAFHGSGTYKDGTKWYRQWQAQFDGQTRQVLIGSHTESSGWLTEPPEGEGWEQVEERKVIDSEYVAGYTEYYVVDGEPSLNVDDASWVTESPSEIWVQFDQRTVVDVEAVPEVVTFYAFTDDKPCDKPDKPKPPVDNPPKDKPEPPAAPELPHTGGDVSLLPWALGALMVGAALTLLGYRRESVS